MVYLRAMGGSAGDSREGNEFVVIFAFRTFPLAGAASFDTIAA
jgi:hypothetical protein